LLVTVAILTAIVLGSWHGWSGYRYLRVERAIARFEADPSQRTANGLRQLIEKRVPTQKQGKRILDLVMRPTVTTRSAYPADRIPALSLAWPYRLNFADAGDTFATLEASVRLNGRGQVFEDTRNVDIVGLVPSFIRCGSEPLPIGTHRGKVQLDQRVIRFGARASLSWRLKRLLQGRSPLGGTLQPIGSYPIRFELPVEIKVVRKEDAEQLRIVSDPNIDEAVHRSLTCETTKYAYGEPEPMVARGEVLRLKWTNVPVALAFESALRLPDGREVPPRRARISRLRARKGESGYLITYGPGFDVKMQGDIRATVVFRPDPNYAYEDPAIKEIWGGTLEFPIAFKIMGIDVE
jgi:hypothetical protein